MKIYVAGTFSSREKLRPIRDTIWGLGHQVVSSWLDEVAKPAFMTGAEFQKKLAMKDMCEVSSADLIIQDCELISGGKNFELGFAVHRFQNALVWTVGEKNNVFQHISDAHFGTWAGCLTYLAAAYPAEVPVDANVVA